jgi:uncharacterized membrane protein YczE
MIKRIITILLGGAITAFGIASLVNSGLGCFGITAAYIGLSNLFGVPLTVISLVVEGLMLVYVCYKGEGVGLSSILACSYVSLLIDIFKLILPHHSLMVIFGICTMLGWAITASADLGEGPTNILTTTLVKSTGKSVAYIRTIIDAIYFIVALLTARQHITIVSIVLVFVTGKITEMFYKLFKYDPVNVKHDYIIQLKHNKCE